MRERNPPRNSQPETHPDDERGRRSSWRPHRMDRFPNAYENSCRKTPRSGLLLLCREIGFELRWRHIAEPGVEPLFVVNFLQELADQQMRLRQIAVFAAKNFFVLERLHKRFAGRVIPRIAFARHANTD